LKPPHQFFREFLSRRKIPPPIPPLAGRREKSGEIHRLDERKCEKFPIPIKTPGFKTPWKRKKKRNPVEKVRRNPKV